MTFLVLEPPLVRANLPISRIFFYVSLSKGMHLKNSNGLAFSSKLKLISFGEITFFSSFLLLQFAILVEFVIFAIFAIFSIHF